jgi:hypothetical protein
MGCLINYFDFMLVLVIYVRIALGVKLQNLTLHLQSQFAVT